MSMKIPTDNWDKQEDAEHFSNLEIFIKLDLSITVGIELIEQLVNQLARDYFALFLKW